MALELNVSKIKNTVTFAVDKNSLKAAKDSITELQKFAENINPAFKVDKVKQQMDNIRKEYGRLQKEIETKGITPKVNNVPQPNGTGARNPRYAPGTNGQTPASQDRVERQRLNRLDAASVARDRFTFNAGRFRNVADSDIASSKLRVDEVTRAFEAGEVSARRMNAVLTRELATLRDIGKQNSQNMLNAERSVRRQQAEEARLERIRERDRRREEAALIRQERALERQRERRNERLSEGVLGLNPRMIMGGLGIAAAVEGISRVVEGLRSTAERVNLAASGARNVQTNPNAIMALTAYGEANGIDSANIKKAIDNIKDVRERIASSVMSASLNKKGQYTGGDSGVDQIMNTFGWNPNQIKRFQSNPLDFIQAIENEGQRRGMAPAQIGHLMENLGDDLMHYEPAFRNGGEELIKFAQMLSDSGASIDDSTAQAAKSFMILDTKLGLVEQGLGNNFLIGFMDGFREDTENFGKTVKNLDAASKWLGQEIGDLATQFSVFVNSMSGVMNWLKTQWPFNKMLDTSPPSKSNPDGNAGTSLLPNTDDIKTRSFQDFLDATNNSGWGELSSTVDRLRNSTVSWNGLDDHQFDFLSSAFNSNQNIGYQNTSQYPLNANVVVPDSAFNINIIPDGTGLSSIFSAQIDSGFSAQLNQLTLDTMGSTSTRD